MQKSFYPDREYIQMYIEYICAKFDSQLMIFQFNVLTPIG